MTAQYAQCFYINKKLQNERINGELEVAYYEAIVVSIQRAAFTLTTTEKNSSTLILWLILID